MTIVIVEERSLCMKTPTGSKGRGKGKACKKLLGTPSKKPKAQADEGRKGKKKSRRLSKKRIEEICAHLDSSSLMEDSTFLSLGIMTSHPTLLPFTTYIC